MTHGAECTDGAGRLGFDPTPERRNRPVRGPGGRVVDFGLIRYDTSGPGPEYSPYIGSSSNGVGLLSPTPGVSNVWLAIEPKSVMVGFSYFMLPPSWG